MLDEGNMGTNTYIRNTWSVVESTTTRDENECLLVPGRHETRLYFRILKANTIELSAVEIQTVYQTHMTIN